MCCRQFANFVPKNSAIKNFFSKTSIWGADVLYGNFLDGTICAPILIGRLIAKIFVFKSF